MRLLLYSDMPIMTAALRSLVHGADGFELAGVSTSLAELRSAVTAQKPDVVLLDLTSEFPPGFLGELDAALLAANVVLWVYEIPPELALHAMSLGVRGILRSTLAVELVLRCLEKVQQGELWYEKALVNDFVDARRTGLTGRETQLVRLLGQGLKNKEIAATLAITEGTVKVYLSRLFQKLGVKDRFELALYGMKNPGADSAPLLRALGRRRRTSPPRALALPYHPEY